VLAGNRPQHASAGTVAEQNTGTAVVPVDDIGEFFGRDHQSVFVKSGLQILFGGGERKKKTAARGAHIKRRGGLGADPALDQTAHRRKSIIRGRGPDHNQIDFSGVNLGLGQRFLRGLDSHMTGAFVSGGDMTLFDAGAGGYPLIRSLDHLLEIVVGHHAVRNVFTKPQDADVFHSLENG